MVGFVFAFASTTSEDKSSIYPNDISGKLYTVTYTMDEPGWYLLPNGMAVVTFENTQDLQSFYRSSDYQYAFSPFSKEYTQCEREPNSNPLVCSFEDIYGISDEELDQLPQESIARNYFAYTALSADWHYYSKPVTIKYQYYPFMLDTFSEGDDDFGLMGAKLRGGWNLIIYPPYLAYQDVELGDCNIEKMYAFNDIGQGAWIQIPEREYVDGELSGAGMAIKVTNDCTFLAEKGSGSAPPSIPSGSGESIPIGENECSVDKIFDPYNNICVGKNVFCELNLDCLLFEGQTVSFIGEDLSFELLNANDRVEGAHEDRAYIYFAGVGEFELESTIEKDNIEYEGYRIILESVGGEEPKIMGATFEVNKI